MNVTARIDQAQSTFLDGLTEIQGRVVEANQKVAKNATKLPTVPTPDGWPTPADSLRRSYDFASKVRDANRAFADQVVAAWYPKSAPKPRAKSSSRAKSSAK